MTLILFLKALLLGLINAAPIGPVGLLCLKKNMEPDRWSGLFAALGMAVAYGIISFCVLFGLKWMVGFLEQYRAIFQIVGGIALIVIGWRSFKSPPAAAAKKKCATRYAGDFSGSFAMTLFNPVPFATFAVTLTALHVAGKSLNLAADIYFALSVCVGTTLFWLVANQILHAAKKRSPLDWSRWINRGAAAALIVFGISLLVAGFLYV